MITEFKFGTRYVCKHGNVWECITRAVSSSSNPLHFFKISEAFNSDCEFKYLHAIPFDDAKEYFISEYKGSFTEELQLINWKNPEAPGYMEFVKKPNEEELETSLDESVFDDYYDDGYWDFHENPEVSQELASKNDNDKPMFACLPPDALMELGKVGALGAKKYGLHNYRKGIQVSRLLDAAFRHLIAAINGEDADKTDGNNHLASVAWNALAAFQILKDKPELDDRYKG